MMCFEIVACNFIRAKILFLHMLLKIEQKLAKGYFMAFPLLLLGAAALSAFAVQELTDDRNKMHRKRKNSNKVETLEKLSKHDSPVAIYPSDMLLSMASGNVVKVEPEIGAIVCCGLGGILDHTGIYIGDNTIVELSGNGLVKAISMNRFIAERSGKQIFIACDSLEQPLVSVSAAQKATEQVFNYYEYDVINNNCHRFIWECFTQRDSNFTTFKALNYRLAKYYNRVIYWDVCKS